MTKQMSAREVALTALDRVRKNGAYSNLQLNQLLVKHKLDDNDRRLATRLVYGVLQRQLTLEYWLQPFVKGKKLDSWVETLLLMSIYQYHYLERVPDWAVTDEAIEIAKHWGNPGIRKFVTGVLHAILRKGLSDLTQIPDVTTRLSIQNSVPEWIVTELIDQYGEQQAEKDLLAINDPAHLIIRANTALTTLDKIKEELTAMGIEFVDSQVVPNTLRITKGSIIGSRLFEEGLITVQDESAMLAVDSMDIQKGDRVLDACAAPGGKTIQIAEQLDPAAGGEVHALDIHEHKTKLIRKNAKRMKVDDRVITHTLDARKVDEEFADESFDKILVDAPCSGMGLLRRKPEIRYTKQLSDSTNLQHIQQSILNAVATKVKKGGIITYSTCTILKQENDQTVQAFLADHPDFTLLKTETSRKLKDDRNSATLTILPSDYGSDGFFISSLQRNL
ncbi:MAG: 16S rRNA (cytosine(967)-C(5))-methyltransferase RsmB [Limosilactobacillus sp.]|uniref:16S rRNA (cytosine(967)-C(5))-methyltransferase RsmB n=1 Tax=Limosilactobacillus sp. TaxID=2773925 RepID=UPI002700F6F2|nr:16S rRNA (cytosine(967)-C(5))-methyltransferase RsmB [Limosilactobacillus sp.]